VTLLDDPQSTPAIQRDRWGRPLITPPDGGKAVAYTRISTAAKGLDDNQGLIDWSTCAGIVGAFKRPGLSAGWQSLIAEHGDPWYASAESKKRAKELVKQSKEAGGSSDRADLGTALHKLTELVDLGRTLEHVQPNLAADVEAYRRTITESGIEVLSDYLEGFVVLDELKVAGSFDSLVRVPDGRILVADKKTGSSLDYSWLSFATQLALYSRGVLYDPATNTRTPLPNVDQTVGLIIHIPAGTGTCALHEVDLVAGWEAAQLSMEVRKWRTRKGLGKPWASSPLPASTATEPPASSPAPSGETSTAATTSTPAASDERAWLTERLEQVKQHPAALQMMRQNWTDNGIPPWAECGPEHFDTVATMLDVVERWHELPFITRPGQLPNLPPEPVARALPDEGKTLSREDYELFAKRVNDPSTPADARAQFFAYVEQMGKASKPLNLGQQTTERRMAIAEAMLAWALVDDEAAMRIGMAVVLGDDRVQPSFSTGALLGALELDEARGLRAIAECIGRDEKFIDREAGEVREVE
jgi:hypothetical protein